MRSASIDIGSNTVRLLVADLASNVRGTIEPLLHERSITRLSGMIEKTGLLDSEGRGRTLEVLEAFVRKASDLGVPVDRIIAAGTSALREASDSGEFIGEARDRTGLNILVLSPEEEASISAMGVISFLPDAGHSFVLDIGGGSTEASEVEGGKVLRHASLRTGVVKLTERHLAPETVAGVDLERLGMDCVSAAEELFGRFRGLDAHQTGFIATAGTATTLASIDMSLEKYDRDAVNGYKLSISAVRDIFRRLSGIALEQRRNVPGLERGREDLIIAGTALTIGVMETFGFEEMTVSDSGLLEGLCIYSFGNG